MANILVPSSANPNSFVKLTTISNKLLVLKKEGILYDVIPLCILNCLTVVLLIEHARIICLGLYLAMDLAQLPVCVNTTIKSIALSLASSRAVED